MPQNNDLNIVAFYEKAQMREKDKWWSQGRGYPTEWPLGRLFQFQITRTPSTGQIILSVTLVNENTGERTGILNRMQSTGLEVVPYTDDDDNYDKIIYPGTIGLGLAAPEIGTYTLEISDGFNVWYSEQFKWCADLSNHVLLEYWHCEDFYTPDSRVRYEAPYKTRIYIPSDIAKPSYQYKERVIEKDATNQPVQQISWKLHKMKCLFTESVLDALRVARQHDEIYITYRGCEYEVDSLLMLPPVWQTGNMVAEVEFEIQTDTIVVVSGRGHEASECLYEVDPVECINAEFNAVAEFLINGNDYTNREYTPYGASAKVDILNDDYVVIRQNDGTKGLWQYKLGTDSYIAVALAQKESVYSANNQQHYFQHVGGLVMPFLSSYVDGGGGSWTVFGEAFEGCLVEVFVVDQEGNETKVGEGFESDLNTGLFFTTSIASFSGFLIKCSTAKCYQFTKSETLLRVSECLVPNHYAVAELVEGGADYIAAEYTPFGGGAKVAIQDNEKVVVVDGVGEKTLERYDASTGTYQEVLALGVKQVVFVQNAEQLYFIKNAEVRSPYIVSLQDQGGGNWTVVAETFKDQDAKIIVRLPDTSEVVVAYAAEDELTIGYFFYSASAFNAVKIVTSSNVCADFDTSEWYELGGIGYMEIGNDFVVS